MVARDYSKPGIGEYERLSARIDRVPAGWFHVKLGSILGTGTFFDAFDAVSLAVVLALVVTSFGISFSEAGLIISAGYLGQFIGAIVVGALADRIGRKKAFILSMAVFGSLSIGCALAWSAESLLVFRLLQGLGLGAEVPIAGTLFNEYLGKHNRGRISIIYQSTFAWGLFFAPLVALILTSSIGPELGWRVLLGIGVLPLGVAVWAMFALPESARWLASKGRVEEAERYVGQIERQALAAGKKLEQPTVAASVKQETFKFDEMFRGVYRRRTAMLATLWFTTFFVTYGYTVWLTTLYISVGGLSPEYSFALTVIIGLVQIVMLYLCALLFIERLGRKTTLTAGFAVALVGALFGVVLIALGNSSWQVLFTSGLLMAIGITIPAGSLYLYTSELYPTRIRGFATSSVSSMARLASIVSPLAIGALMDEAGTVLIFAMLAIMALTGLAVISLAGIETRNRPLDEISA